MDNPSEKMVDIKDKSPGSVISTSRIDGTNLDSLLKALEEFTGPVELVEEK